MQKKVIIIGGGIVGLSCAFFLSREGHQVEIIDKSTMDGGASYVNAGYLTPSHIVPLAAPGMITKGLKWMLDSSSPFYIKPRLDLDLMDWGIKFMRSCTKKHVKRSLKVIKDINVMSKELYHEFDQLPDLDFHIEDLGVMMAYQSLAAEKSEGIVMREAKQMGLAVEQLTQNQIFEIQPDCEMNISGAYLYRCDGHTTPGIFMEQLKKHLAQIGVKIHGGTTVQSFQMKGNKLQQINTSKGDFSADEIVVAAGAWTQNLLKSIGINLPVQAGKGYSLNEVKPTGISIPAILMERKIAVTPMQGFTRFSGTMEIAGIQHAIKKNRVYAIAKGVNAYYPSVQLSNTSIEQARCGLRPLSPDGLPFIGKLQGYKNLTLATGHAMMGWSLGPATGKLVAEIISNQKTSLDLSPFSPGRRYG